MLFIYKKKMIVNINFDLGFDFVSLFIFVIFSILKPYLKVVYYIYNLELFLIIKMI